LATLSFVLGVLRSVAWAASTLHSKGICHGDLYAHNILLKPTSKSTNRCGDEGNQEKKGAACVEGENKDEIEEGQEEEEGFAVLSDLGAATFYKQNAGAGVASKAGEDEAAQLVERIEVLAVLSREQRQLPPTSMCHFCYNK
jgi:serine/threonine protein kinase